MAFIPAKQSDNTILSQADRIRMIVKARGFETSGTYKFIGNTGVSRKPESIANGVVSGHYDVNDRKEPIVFSRVDYPNEKQWHRICKSFGLQYHQINDIETFVINTNGSVTIHVKIVTPVEEI